MALLVGGRFRVTTAAGAIVSGGKVRLYNANTTTLSSVYSDAALTVPLVNPVVAWTDGFTPQIFAADGLTVDVDFLTAGDLVIAGQSLVDAAFVGSTSSSLVRDFGTSRFQARGAGGRTYVETGDPSGDDTGGRMTLGGWNGTQADDISLNGAIVNVTGALTEGGHSIPAVVYTGVTTFTAATEVVITLPSYPTGAISWDVRLWGMSYTADCQMRGVFSIDNGANYKTGAGDYAIAVHAAYNNTQASVNDSAEAYMHFTDTVNVKSTSTGCRLDLDIISTATTTATTAFSRFFGSDATGSLPAIWTASNNALLLAPATTIKVYPSAGNFTGKYMVIARRGFA
jgi:hypothetical protein